MILLTGVGGQLGHAFRALLPDALGVGKKDLDFREADAIRQFVLDIRPELVINCAAYTAVDAAETNPELAYAINAAAPISLAQACRDVGAKLVTYSTDYVFAGTKPRPYVESDEVSPQNVYGRTKAEGEVGVLRTHGDSLVIRTSWLLSPHAPNFVSTILRLASEGVVQVVDDQIGTPTIAADLAKATLEAVGQDATGILHLANSETMSWFDLARRVVSLAGIEKSNVQPCTTEEMPRPAKRPRNGALRSERLADLGVQTLPSIDIGLLEVVGNLVGRGG